MHRPIRHYCLFFILSIACCCANITNVFAQVTAISQDSLIIKLEKVWNAKNDETKRMLNNDFKKFLRAEIQKEGSFNYPFDSLKLGILKSPDNTFRIFNWNIELSTETYEYFCLIQKVDKKGNTTDIIELIDKITDISKLEMKELKPYEWFGALYYEIIPFKKNNQQLYALIGLDINNRFSKKKVIEVLSFNNNTVTLGAPVFKLKKGIQKRFILECAYDNQLTMRYQAKGDVIIFNHLEPLDIRLENQFDYYVNDLSFDGFKFDKKKELWLFIDDVDAKNGKSKNDYMYNTPDKDKLNDQ